MPDYPSQCPYRATLAVNEDETAARDLPLPSVPAIGSLLIVDGTAWEVTSPAQWLVPAYGSHSWREGSPVMITLLVREHPGIFGTPPAAGR